MAFIVEMWRGAPHEIIVQELDDDGELCERTIPLPGPQDREPRTFSCHADNWDMAQKAGVAFGWQPTGPLFHSYSDRNALPVRESKYSPDGWIRGTHEVGADDARAWGVALERCAREIEAGRFTLPEVRSTALVREGMTLDEYRRANRGLTVQFLRSFAAFLAKGQFKFGWDS